MSEWISVKDRLPTDFSIVLCTGFEYDDPVNDRFYLVSRYERGFGYYDTQEEKWANNTSDYITHWMPLPEPPVE
jgi:hypothetical protein